VLERNQCCEQTSEETRLSVVNFHLSQREYQILVLLANGNTGNDIAEHLRISPQTVKNHIHSAYKKMSVTNRMQAFLELGWLTPPEPRHAYR
jgi:DNA-binding NarL/FixJ family response regulator